MPTTSRAQQSRDARRRLLLTGLAAWCCVLDMTIGCSPYSHTTRILEGREVEGRPIRAEAYTAYLQGARLEAAGESEAAAAAFSQALSFDPESPEIQTALARAVCRFAPRSADAEFVAALELDPNYEPAHRGRARCALSRGKRKAAKRAALAAVASSPFSYSATEVLVDVLWRLGEAREAVRYLAAFLSLEPKHQEAARRLEALRSRSANPERVAETRSSGTGLERPSPETFHAIQKALRDGDDERATDLALAARIPRVALARLALAEARPDFALTQSHLVLFANPNDSDARILALVAATLLQDGRAYRAALRKHGSAPELPTRQAAAELASLLEAKAGSEAARLFGEAYARARAERETAAPPPLPPHRVWRDDEYKEQPPQPAPGQRLPLSDE